MPTLPQLALSGLLYPAYAVEGFVRGELGIWNGRAARGMSAVIGVLTGGATALFLLRSMALPAGIRVALTVYLVGAMVTIASRVLFAALSRDHEDAA